MPVLVLPDRPQPHDVRRRQRRGEWGSVVDAEQPPGIPGRFTTAIRFFADQCVPRSISIKLRSAGWDMLILKDYLATDAPDPQVIAKAQELGCLLLSLNGDFSDIVAYSPDQYLGIVSLQIKYPPLNAGVALLTGGAPSSRSALIPFGRSGESV